MNQRDDVEGRAAAEPASAIAPRSEPAQPASKERTAPRRVALLSQLERLLPSQFEAVVFRARIPTGYLPGGTVSQTERAIAVLRYIEQQDQLDRLERIVQQVGIGGGQAGRGRSPRSRSPKWAGIGGRGAPREGGRGRAGRFVLGFVVFVVAAVTVVLIAVGLHGDTPRPPIGVPPGVAAGPPDAQTVPARPPSPQPTRPPSGGCPAGMVRVPAGTFRMGSVEGTGNATKPRPHAVALATYCIDRTEVMVKAYADCVKAGGCTASPHTVQWHEPGADDLSTSCNGDERPDHPINCVDWNQARAYCTWAGKRLPTEAEWEYAARGTDGREYPWGNDEPRATRLNACGLECVAMVRRERNKSWHAMYHASDDWETTAPVGSFPEGASPFGALDMAGNVLEWTADRFAAGAGVGAASSRSEWIPRKPRTGYVIRGGAWNDYNPTFVRATSRRGADPADRAAHLGFRCARGG
jgi:sulfatase modifying factor 1